MKLLAAVVLLFTLGALGDVVKDFTRCKEFFLNGVPPRIVNIASSTEPNRYKEICQKYNNKYHFATLYDTVNKIPVYSAYEFKKGTDCKVERPKGNWRIEPQDQNGEPRQASDSDYTGSGYTRGHLFPVCHTDSDETAKSTFTLTNAAPQEKNFNGNYWANQVEQVVIGKMQEQCLNRGIKPYVVTGVVPSTLFINNNANVPSNNKNKVNIPSHYWSAYICCENKETCTFGGYTMKNNEKTAKHYTEQDKLETELKRLYQTNCPLEVFTISKDSAPSRLRSFLRCSVL